MVIIKFGFFLLLLLYIIIYIYRRGKDILYILPVIFILLEIYKNILFEFSIEYGFNGYQNLIVLIIVLYLLNKVVKSYVFYRYAFFVLIFLVYVFTRIPFSDDPVSLLTKYTGLTNSLLLIPLSSTIAVNKLDLFKLNRGVILALKFFVFYLLIASLLKFGPNHYGTDIIYGLRFEQYYLGSLALVIMPVALEILPRSKKKNLIFLSVITFIILSLTLRRTSIIIVILGLLLYSNFIPKNKQLYSNIIYFLLTFIIAIIIILNTNITSYRATEYSSDYNIEEEGRYIEMELVINTLKKSGAYFIGTGEMFNSPGQYNFKDPTRPLHGTLSKILFGSGILGIVLFFMIYLELLRKAYLLKNCQYIKSFCSYRSLQISLVLVLLAVTFTGGIGVGTGIAFTGTINVYIGVLNGILDNRKLNLYTEIK